MEAFGRGAAQGASLGFADELVGGAEALYDIATGEPTLADLPEQYRQRRDESRAAFRAAEEASPGAYRTGEVGGALASALIPGGAVARGVGGAIRTGAALGAAQGLGESEADLTEGEYGEALADVGAGGVAGGVLGGAGGALAKGVGAVGRRLAGRAQRGVQKATGEIEEEAAKRAGKEIRSLSGELGAEVQKGSRQVENLERVGGRLEGPEARLLQEMTPERLALEQRVARGNLQSLPGQVGRIEAADIALQNALQNLPTRQAQLAGEIGSVRRQFYPRIATLGHRLLPAALAGAGGVLGGPEGAAVGAGLGGVMALTQGRPGIIIRNLVRSPATRRALWNAVLSIAPQNPQRLGRFGLMLTRALAQGGEQEGEALHAALLESEPEYADALAAVLDEEGANDVEAQPEAYP